MPSYLDTSFAGWGIVSFLGTLILHVLVWRFFLPRRHFLMLLVIFFGVPGLALLAKPSWAFFCPAFIHAVLAVNYIAIYPAFQAASPTIQLLNLLHSRPYGTTTEKIISLFAESDLVNARLSDLQQSGLISRSESPRLSFFARLMVRAFLSYRALLGLPQGAG